MTTAPPRARLDDHADDGSGVLFPGPRRPGRARRKSLFTFDAAGPVVWLLAAWPLWWIIGIGDYIVVLLAIPMAARMLRWRANGRHIKVPPAFGLWLLFFVVTVAGLATVSLSAPDTLNSPVSHRIISWAIRTADYVGGTILLLYAGNLTERELPRRRLAWLLGLVGIYTVIGGFGGMVAPKVQFNAVLSYVIPQSLQASNTALSQMLHPGFSQVMTFLGYAEGRPDAPFDYTNMWGNCLAILLPWLMVAAWEHGTGRRRWVALGVLIASFLPIVYSLDRGLWVGVGCGIAYLAIRLALRGRIALLAGVIGLLAVAALAVAVTPIQSLISQRLAHGASNDSRLNLSVIAYHDALASPIIGFGDTRHELGSAQSIAVGKTANCHACGNQTVGGNGQFWMLLVTSGFVGTACYVGFFAFGVWRFRRDPTPYGLAGLLVLLLGFVFMFVYEVVGPTLNFVVLSYVLLWRNDIALRHPGIEEEAGELPSGSGPAVSDRVLA